MKKSSKIIQSSVANPQAMLGQNMLINGIINNLPDILSTVREIYTKYREGQTLQYHLQAKLGELELNKSNFGDLVRALTELSKVENADPETKNMYRDIIKVLFDCFVDNTRTARDINDYFSKA